MLTETISYLSWFSGRWSRAECRRRIRNAVRRGNGLWREVVRWSTGGHQSSILCKLRCCPTGFAISCHTSRLSGCVIIWMDDRYSIVRRGSCCEILGDSTIFMLCGCYSAMALRCHSYVHCGWHFVICDSGFRQTTLCCESFKNKYFNELLVLQNSFLVT